MNASRVLLISLLMLTALWIKPIWAQDNFNSATQSDAATPVRNTTSDVTPDWKKNEVKVPNVVGLWRDEAILDLFKAGLRIGDVREETSTSVSDHHVISEFPAAGTEVKGGSKVDLVIARAPEVKVPDVVGLTLGAAKTALDKVDLKVGRIEEKPSTTVAAGLIISQHPQAGTTVREDRKVRLVVSKGTSQDTVPNVIGATQAAAATAIASAGLTVGTVTSQSSPTVAAGLVISESPAAGSTVISGSAVNLVVSTGVAKVTVPNVVGLTQAAATTAITGAGLAVGSVTTQSSSTVAAGLVISESPVAGTTVTSNSTVALIVSSGLPQVKVPNVVGLTQAAATTAITSVGLIVGTVTTQFSSTVKAGVVISESPIASTSVISGSAVNLVIASASPTVTSISVAPNASSLLLNATLQFVASGQYSDGTVKDVTGLVVWSSSAPSIASISSTGLLNGVSAGGAKISATIGSVQGSTAVTIGASSTGFTLISDVTDSRLLTYTYSDGSIATFFGSRDATGLPTTINTVVVTFSDQSSETIQLDAAQRPALISLSKGGQISLNWTSATVAILTATSPDGTAQVTTSLNVATPTAQSSTVASNKLKTMLVAPTKMLAGRATNASSAGTNQQISVQVQTCGQPEDQATVVFDKVGQFGGNPVPGVAQGGGLYTADLSSGSGGLSIGPLSSAAQSSLNTACQAISEGQAGGLPPIAALGTEMCLAITAAIDTASGGLTIPESAAIQAACVTTGAGLKVLSGGCQAEQTIVAATTSVVDYYLANTTFGVQATATVQGIGTLLESTDNVGPQGPFTVTPITFSCPSVSTVTVAPPSLTLSEGGTAPVTAEIDGSLGIIRSSGVTPSWTPASGAEATVAQNPPALSATGVQIGSPSATVTAGNIPTGNTPVDITATFKGGSGTAQVTVTAPVSLQITQTLPTVAVGSTITLNVTATSGGITIPTPPNLEWSSDADSVATVINAVVTGVSAGPALITVTDPVSQATASVTVTVISGSWMYEPAFESVGCSDTDTISTTVVDGNGNTVFTNTQSYTNNCPPATNGTPNYLSATPVPVPLQSGATYTVTTTWSASGPLNSGGSTIGSIVYALGTFYSPVNGLLVNLGGNVTLGGPAQTETLVVSVP